MDIERSGNQQNTSDISQILMLNFDTTQKNVMYLSTYYLR